MLSKYNIKYILNVTPNLPNMFEHEGDFKYKQIPISDHWSQNLSQFFPEAISFIGKSKWRQLSFYGVIRSLGLTRLYELVRNVENKREKGKEFLFFFRK